MVTPVEVIMLLCSKKRLEADILQLFRNSDVGQMESCEFWKVFRVQQRALKRPTLSQELISSTMEQLIRTKQILMFDIGVEQVGGNGVVLSLPMEEVYPKVYVEPQGEILIQQYRKRGEKLPEFVAMTYELSRGAICSL